MMNLIRDYWKDVILSFLLVSIAILCVFIFATIISYIPTFIKVWAVILGILSLPFLLITCVIHSVFEDDEEHPIEFILNKIKGNKNDT